jgi:predicted enzyme related to lactoylglutathione lyase
MPHGKICYLEIPAKTAQASAGTWVKEADRTPDERSRTYIMVDGIAETLKRIESAGGRVLTPRTDIAPGMGAFAIFADPVGNEFGLYEEPRR